MATKIQKLFFLGVFSGVFDPKPKEICVLGDLSWLELLSPLSWWPDQKKIFLMILMMVVMKKVKVLMMVSNHLWGVNREFGFPSLFVAACRGSLLIWLSSFIMALSFSLCLCLSSCLSLSSFLSSQLELFAFVCLYLSGQQIPTAICFYCRPGLPASKVVIGPAARSVLTIAMHRRHNRH